MIILALRAAIETRSDAKNLLVGFVDMSGVNSIGIALLNGHELSI